MACWKDRILLAVGTAFGLGFAPVAPGTAGALLGVGAFVCIALAAPAALQPWLIAACLLFVCVLTILMSPWAERHWGRKDPPRFVLDEVAGFLLTVLLFRGTGMVSTAVWAFGVTRLADIVKPPPARQLERLPAGWGILMDDLCTSLYAAAALHLLIHQFPALFQWSL